MLKFGGLDDVARQRHREHAEHQSAQRALAAAGRAACPRSRALNAGGRRCAGGRRVAARRYLPTAPHRIEKSKMITIALSCSGNTERQLWSAIEVQCLIGAARTTLRFPVDRVADSDRPAVEHFRKGAAAPALAHRPLKYRPRLPPSARMAGLAANTQPARDRRVGSRPRVFSRSMPEMRRFARRAVRCQLRRADFLHQLGPSFFREQRDLAADRRDRRCRRDRAWLENGGETSIHAPDPSHA